MLKIFQYGAYLVCEYNLMKWVKKLDKAGIEYEFNRFKRLGSDLSTMRMCLRLLLWLRSVNWLLEQIRAYLRGEKPASVYDYLRKRAFSLSTGN